MGNYHLKVQSAVNQCGDEIFVGETYYIGGGNVDFNENHPSDFCVKREVGARVKVKAIMKDVVGRYINYFADFEELPLICDKNDADILMCEEKELTCSSPRGGTNILFFFKYNTSSCGSLLEDGINQFICIPEADRN